MNVFDVRSVLLRVLLSRFLKVFLLRLIMRKGCEITVCWSGIFLLYWAVNDAGVMI